MTKKIHIIRHRVSTETLRRRNYFNFVAKQKGTVTLMTKPKGKK
jgi:hypothetical protein|tara:strand:+ start:600 stop:731 length:132 start_codon:yes stop_codon:yes gene_type:complete